jgi:hypothetical protein
MPVRYDDPDLKVRIDRTVTETRRLVRNTHEILMTVGRQNRMQRAQLESERLARQFQLKSRRPTQSPPL